MRDNSVTIAKGITIMLMVMGHSDSPIWLNNYLAMLRMPLFFFMSGYCFKLAYLNDWKTFMKKRIKGIYWPFVKWCTFFLLCHNLFFQLNIFNDEFGFRGNTSYLYSTNEILMRLFRIIFSMIVKDALLGGFWFLKSLFWGSIIFYLTRKVIKSPFWGAIFLLCVTFFATYFHLQIPFYKINPTDFLAAVFLMFGHYFKSKKIEIKTTLPWILGYGLLIAIGTYLSPASMRYFDITSLLPYTACALMGTLMIFGISKLIVKKEGIWYVNVLIFIGNHTFEVLTWHLLAFRIVSLFIIMVYGMRIQHLAEAFTIHTYAIKGWWVIYTFIGIAVPIIWTYFYSRLLKKIKC
jgi:fucose 4-O-acetylase-like acetyltransferase